MPRTPKELADRMAARRRQAKADDGFARETFTQLENKLARRQEHSSIAGRRRHT